MKRIKPKYEVNKFENSVAFYYNGWKKNGLGYIDKKYIKKNTKWINDYKLFVPKAIGIGDSKADIIKPVVPERNSCCSETYIVIGPFRSKQEIKNVQEYINTKFFHFLVSLKKITQEARRGVYSFVPIQDFSEPWTDQKLYNKYSLTSEEIDFIESNTLTKGSNNNFEENE